jgi:leader peptidase (prepilin peptidase)/N-methyltransferase
MDMMIILGIAGLLGLLVGSFLNVIIHRLPIMMQRAYEAECRTFLNEGLTATSVETKPIFNIAWPGSHCPACKHSIHPLDNIPVFSFFWLGRQCRHCHAAISWRYPCIELLTALITVLMAYTFGLSLQLPFVLLLCWGLLALFFIDWDTQYLPDSLTLPLLWLGLIANLNGFFTDLHSAVLGAIGGYLALWSVTALYALLTKKIGMGQGDFKLLAVLGAWLGWQQLPFLILTSSALGLIVGLGILFYKKQNLQTPLAFGPYIIVAGVIVLLCKNNLLLWV